MQRGCVIGLSPGKVVGQGHWNPWSVLVYSRACFCKHGQAWDTYTALFTFALMKLIRPQVIKALKYGNVPRKLIKQKEKEKFEKLAFSEIRLFLENQLLEFH